MSIDLTRHAEQLGDPDDYFVHESGGAVLVVHHGDGRVRWRVIGDELAPFDGVAVVAEPPPQPSQVDLEPYRDHLGDPTDYFTHATGGQTLVIRHVDGRAVGRLGLDGSFGPMAAPPPPSTDVNAASMEAVPGTFALGGIVVNPEDTAVDSEDAVVYPGAPVDHEAPE